MWLFICLFLGIWLFALSFDYPTGKR